MEILTKLRRKYNKRFSNFVFIHIPKTAGTSISEALNLDIEHKTALEKLAYFGRERWERKFKFAFVRNPWDRLISYYTYKKIKGQEGLGGEQTIPFRDWVRASLVDRDPAYWRPKYFAPQFDWVSDANGAMMLDFIGKVENLDRDFAEICARIGVDRRLEHRNKSERGDYRGYYDDETRRIVAEAFRKDIDYFGYTF